MKLKKTLLSLVLSAAMLFAAGCSQQDSNVELSSNSSVSASSNRTSAKEESPAESPATVEGNGTEPVESDSQEQVTAGGEDNTSAAPVEAATEDNKTENSTTEAAAKPATTTTATTTTTTTTSPEPAPSVKGGFKVEGTKLLDANGNEFIMRGINHAHVWYRSNLDEALQGIANTGANCVRIVLGDGNSTNGWGPTSEDEIRGIIEKCKSKKLICILESHNPTGSDNVSDLNKAVEYWKKVKNAFVGEEQYVIINIANEWFGSWDNLRQWGNTYVDAVKELRSAGIHNTLMVDSAGWGQCAKSVPQFGEKILAADPEKNTMFSIHMYGSAGGSKSQIKSNIDNVLSKNLCLVIGEFGWNHSDGDVDEDYIMQYCTERNVGYIGWSWKGNSGGVEYLDISNDWSGNSLSDWGKNLVNNTYGIKKTSKICTVF